MGRFPRLAQRRRRTRADRGAAAVEFALIMPLLFLIVFGIIQYGLYFFDAHGTRAGVREAARQGVVENFSQAGCAGTSSAQLACKTWKQIDSVTADTTWVRVQASDWSKGEPLLVCALIQSDGGIGLLPMPDAGWIRTETQMSIEQVAGKASWSDTTRAFPDDRALPVGQDWSWCG